MVCERSVVVWKVGYARAGSRVYRMRIPRADAQLRLRTNRDYGTARNLHDHSRRGVRALGRRLAKAMSGVRLEGASSGGLGSRS